MGKRPKPKRRHWRIFLARQKAAYLGTVEASDVASAVEVGAKVFGYPASRLIAEEDPGPRDGRPFT